MALPRKSLLAAAALTLTFGFAASAEPKAPAPTPQNAPATKPQRGLAGLPLYTSDGKAIGKVIAMGLDEDNKPVLVAEIERPLGIGPTAVAVPLDMFARKGDRIELTLTEAEVNARLESAK